MVARRSGCRSNGDGGGRSTPGPWRRCPERGSVAGFVAPPAAFGSGARRMAHGERQRHQGDARRAWSLVAAMVARGSGCRSNGDGGGRSTPGAVAPLPRAGVGGRVRRASGCLRQRRTANGERQRHQGDARRAWSLVAAMVARGSGCRSNGDGGGRSTPGPWRRCPERESVAGFVAPSAAFGSGARRTANDNGTRATLDGRGRSWRRWSLGDRAAARTADGGGRSTPGPWRRCPERGSVAGCPTTITRVR
jgi:hypothetical protein